MILKQEIISIFKEHANPIEAAPMKKYMKNKFEYFGIKSPLRKEITKDFMKKANLPERGLAFDLVKELWQEDERELQYFSQEFLFKYSKEWISEDYKFFEYLITSKSWWDSIDFIASNIVGTYFKRFPEMIDSVCKQWMDSNNIWLQRTCILYQLKYKLNTDTTRLSAYINQVKHNKEFFIQKAIGWSLREYSKTNPEWVIKFVEEAQLVGLAKREALRKIV